MREEIFDAVQNSRVRRSQLQQDRDATIESTVAAGCGKTWNWLAKTGTPGAREGLREDWAVRVKACHRDKGSKELDCCDEDNLGNSWAAFVAWRKGMSRGERKAKRESEVTVTAPNNNSSCAQSHRSQARESSALPVYVMVELLLLGLRPNKVEVRLQ